MSKRKRFILVSMILTIGLFALQYVPTDRRYLAIGGFSFLSLLLSGLSLFSDIKGYQWFTALALPTLYPTSVALFYFLLPGHLLARLALLLVFGVGMYALLLTENIFAVASVRTIQLVRAGHAAGFLITIATSIFLLGTLFSFKWPFWINGVLTVGAFLLLSFQSSWMATFDRPFARSMASRAVFFSLMSGELAMIVSVLPMVPLVSAIFVSGYLYVILGLTQHAYQERLFSKTIQEYLLVGIMVVVSALFVTFRE